MPGISMASIRRCGCRLWLALAAGWLTGCALLQPPPTPGTTVDRFRFHLSPADGESSSWHHQLRAGLCRARLVLSLHSVRGSPGHRLRLASIDDRHWLEVTARHDPVSNRIFFTGRSSVAPAVEELAEDYAVGEAFVLDVEVLKGQIVLTLQSRATFEARLPGEQPLLPGHAFEFPWPVRGLEIRVTGVEATADPMSVESGC